jgi:hypothetical protein
VGRSAHSGGARDPSPGLPGEVTGPTSGERRGRG